MWSAVWHDQRNMKLEDVDEPVVGPEDVKVRVKYAGICHTDVYEYLYGPLTIFKSPIVLGHEFSGIVEEVGEKVTGVSPGEKVTGLPYYPCWKCHYCLQDYWNMCLDPKAHAMHINGAFADYIPLHYRAVYKLADKVSLEEGATVEPMSVAWRAIKRSGLSEGGSVFIVGSGPIGLALVMAAKCKQASAIIVSDPLENRRQKALEVGATYALDPGCESPYDVVRELTDGLGAEVSFDAAGCSETLDAATSGTRKNGRIGMLGFFYEPSYELTVMMAIANEFNYFATLGYATEMQEVVDLVNRGLLNPGAMVTKTEPFDHIVDCFDRFEENRSRDLKILLEMR